MGLVSEASASNTPRQVAIMGGTFNPIHHGHLIMADRALDQFHLDQVLWIPAGDPPHKVIAPGASSADRLEMVRRAIADHPQFVCSDREIRRQGRSYTVKTLEELVAEEPETRWHWMIGVDALADLPSWFEVDRVVQLCDWIVAPRVGPQEAAQVIAEVSQQLPIHAQILAAPIIEISSTLIRQQVWQGGSIRYLVPPAVETYIWDHQLYRDPEILP